MWLPQKNNLAWVLRSQRKLPEAELLIREALALHREVEGTTNAGTVQMLLNLGVLCSEQGKVAAAEEADREALAHSIVTYGENDPRVAGSLILLARRLCDLERPAEAANFARQGGAILEGKEPVKWGAYRAQAVLGRCFSGLTNDPDAEPRLLSGCEGLERLQDTVEVANKIYLKEAVQSLIKLYEATGQSEKSAHWKKKLTELDHVEPEKKVNAP